MTLFWIFFSTWQHGMRLQNCGSIPNRLLTYLTQQLYILASQHGSFSTRRASTIERLNFLRNMQLVVAAQLHYQQRTVAQSPQPRLLEKRN